MHECVRETPLRFPIALLYLRALLWRSIDSIGGLSRLSTNHGVLWIRRRPSNSAECDNFRIADRIYL